MKSLVTLGFLLSAKFTHAADIREDLKDDRVELGVTTLRSVTEGLKLYDHVDNLTVCDFQT